MDYRIDIKVRNNNIVKRIEDAGYKTVGEFCRLEGVCSSRLGDVVNMKLTPLNAKGDFWPFLHKAALLLGCDPSDFFTDVQLNTALESNKRSIEVAEAELQFMIENAQQPKMLEEIIMQDDIKRLIEESLDRLTPREKKVVTLRYGLGGVDKHTWEEIGAHFDVTRERVRQIEARAMRKLRHPSRAEPLRHCLEELDE